MSQNNRQQDPSARPVEAFAALGALLVVTATGVFVHIALDISHQWAGDAGTLPKDPFARIIGLFRGTVTWLDTTTWLVAGFSVALLLIAGLFLWLYMRGRKNRTRVDRKASYLGAGRDIGDLRKKSVAEKARRLGVEGSLGIPLGVTVITGEPLFGSWEDMLIDISGPRTGKTTSRVVPAILAAPGAVLATSNKRDVVDATRDVRASAGDVWVFDPQSIAFEPPSWFWDPLSYVTDEVKAARLAEHFASGSRAPGARTDAYFDPAGQDLLAGLFLAAAFDRRPITDVYRWLT